MMKLVAIMAFVAIALALPHIEVSPRACPFQDPDSLHTWHYCAPTCLHRFDFLLLQDQVVPETGLVQVPTHLWHLCLAVWTCVGNSTLWRSQALKRGACYIYRLYCGSLLKASQQLNPTLR